MKNHFFIPYFGNKREEVEKIYETIKDKIDDAEIIIEPYCGTSAMSYYIWSKNPTKKVKYILNDNNKMLYELYTIAKDPVKFNELVDKLKELLLSCTSKNEYLKIVKEKDKSITSYIFGNKIYNIRPYLYPSTRKINPEAFKVFENAPIIKFLREADIEIKNEDAYKLYTEYKNNPKCLILLDPPYLTSDNDFYSNSNLNIYEKLAENDIKNEKSNIVLCLGNNWIIKLLFKNYKSVIYDKKYQTTKKSIEHIIIMNK